jgi:isoleucyl-tRNA synthetase
LAGEVALRAAGESEAFLRSFGDDLRFVFITSQARVAPDAIDGTPTALTGVTLSVAPSAHRKCERCWHYRKDVGADPAYPELCGRCVANLYGAGEPRAYA